MRKPACPCAALLAAVLALAPAAVVGAGGSREAAAKEPTRPLTGDWQEWADANRNRVLEPEEAQRLVQALAGLVREPHPVGTPLDEWFDRDHNGRIEPPELMEARQVFFGARFLRLAEVAPEAAERLDFNRNRRIDPEEVEYLRDFLFFIPRLREPRRVTTPQDTAMDLNGDKRLDAGELQRIGRQMVRIAALVPGPNPVRTAEPGPADQPREGLVPEGEARFYPIETPVDEVLDLNGDGRVELAEIEETARLFAAGPREAGGNRLDRQLDADRDGRIEDGEITRAVERFFLPHPVRRDQDLDKKLDRNRDGFVDPQEIGLAAGSSPAGPVPSLESLLERQRRQPREGAGPAAAGGATEAPQKPGVVEVQKKLGRLEGKRLAVVGLNAASQNVDEETRGGILTFVENAFVNAGTVKVVDRRNVEQIIAEHDFQLSDLSDEKTAIQVGKLSGADLIAIGGINQVGGRYYLNVKLISVENGEIIGSSIADAAEPAGFYDMCNVAVSKLF